jgi:aldehyde dehydrogenase (NAD+)
MTVNTPAPLQHLIAGQWITGRGEDVRSVNPSRPHAVIAEGGAASAADVDTAVAAAAEAARGWAGTPIAARGAVLLAAAEIVDRAKIWQIVDQLAAAHGGNPRDA